MIRRKEEKQEGKRQEEHASAASASAGAMIPYQTRVNKGLRHLQPFASQRQMRHTVTPPLALSTAAAQTRPDTYSRSPFIESWVCILK